MSAQRHGVEQFGAAWVEPHANGRIKQRIGDGRNPYTLWREATPVDAPWTYGEPDARYHAGEDVVLIADGGALTTVIELADRNDLEQRYVREQVENASGGGQA